MGLDNPIHLALLLLIMLLVFGAKRLPEMGRSLGDGLRGFKDAVNTDGSSVKTDAPTEVLKAPVAVATITADEPEAAEQPLASAGSEAHQA